MQEIQFIAPAALHDVTFSIGVSYRFNKSGFTEWNNRPPKRDKNKEVFNYKGVTK